jgi:hypothetical protein
MGSHTKEFEEAPSKLISCATSHDRPQERITPASRANGRANRCETPAHRDTRIHGGFRGVHQKTPDAYQRASRTQPGNPRSSARRRWSGRNAQNRCELKRLAERLEQAPESKVGRSVVLLGRRTTSKPLAASLHALAIPSTTPEQARRS